MIIKLAILPSALSIPAPAIDVGTNMVIGSNIHDLGHFLFSKGNKLGRAMQRSAIADAIIAAKKAREGKVYGNRTIAGLALYNLNPQKILAMHETNQLVHNTPKILQRAFFDFDKKDKLNVSRIREVLRTSSWANDTAATVQITAPTGLAALDYSKAKKEGKTTQQAIRAGISGGIKGAGITAALYVPRIALKGAAGLHKTLSKDKNYGYKMIEEASSSAAKSMHRPSWLNYSKHVYVTPEQNLHGKASVVGNVVNKIMGLRRPVKVNAVNEYEYDDGKRTMIDRIKSKVDVLPKVIFGVNLK